LHKIIPRAIIAMKQGRKIPLHGGGRAVKSYIHVRDVSRGELAILEHGRLGEMYHLSPDQGAAVRDVVRMLAEMLGKRFEDVTETVEDRPGQDAAYVISSRRARDELSWRPEIDLREGLAETVRWVEEYWGEIENSPLEYQHRP
jgi:dTDP-glucose 4,6-dehydratase